MRVFIFGLGYCGNRIANCLCKQATSVAGTCRSPERATEASIDAYAFDEPTAPLHDAERLLGDVTHVLSTIGPCGDDGHDPVLAVLRDTLLSAPNLKWVGYLSATSVYGNVDGDWVDESSPVRPSNDRGRKRAAAEKEWIELGEKKNVPVHVFRIGAIYGEGRNSLEMVQSGRVKWRISRPGHVFSRIHVDDIVQVVIASMRNHSASNPAIYNLVDDKPMAAHEVVEYACKLLGREELPLIDWCDDHVAMMKPWYSDSKRVRNGKIKSELGVSLKYPTVIEGLNELAKSLLNG
eukprot:m.764 g.764  ORF g.764 m.764 type:complete len:293 (+) comp4809_c0_seq1:15-893(+)